MVFLQGTIRALDSLGQHQLSYWNPRFPCEAPESAVSLPRCPRGKCRESAKTPTPKQTTRREHHLSLSMFALLARTAAESR